jgi:hypothetical protein
MKRGKRKGGKCERKGRPTTGKGKIEVKGVNKCGRVQNKGRKGTRRINVGLW